MTTDEYQVFRSQVMIVEETQYDEVVTCDHSYNKRCHTSYVTSYVSTQQEECDENFRSLGQVRPDLSFYIFVLPGKFVISSTSPRLTTRLWR